MKVTISTCILLLAPLIGMADTLTLTNNSSLNGSVRYDKDTFYVEARYSTETKHLKIPRSDVVKDEINDEIFNSGSPPPEITAYQIPEQAWTAIDSPTPSGETASNKKDPPLGIEKIKRVDKKTTGAATQSSQAAAGSDILALVDKKEVVGTLIRMTGQVIVFKKNGEQSETEYQRNKVRVVTIGR